MNCHKHSDRSAMAVCCGCGRAICNECAIESKSNRLVCSAGCATRAVQIDDVLNQILKKQVRGNLVGSWFLWLAGVAFLITGASDLLHGKPYWPFPVGLSAVFFVSGYWYFRLSKKNT